MIPIEHSREGEHVILRAWIRSITNESVYPGFIEGEPGGVEVGYNGSSVDEVAIVEMVVVIISINNFEVSVSYSRRGFEAWDMSSEHIFQNVSQGPRYRPK